jgi:uncharacterized protein (DUF2062 family)
MFSRREKKTFLKRFRNFFWPEMGWLKTSNYWAQRISRLPGSVYSIAGGFACGAAISFTPFVGLHFLLGGIWAWCMRTNVIASAIGTAVGNPWTFPFIWVWIYNLGMWMGFDNLAQKNKNLDFAVLFSQAVDAALKFDFSYLSVITWPIIGPMLLGSIPTVAGVWLLFYYVIKYIINHYRVARN